MRLASVQPYTTPGGSRRYAVRWREGGRQRWRSFRLRKDAIAVARDTERRVDLGHLYEEKPETLGDFLEGWLERHALKVRSSTLKRRTEALRSLGVLGSTEYLERLSVAQVEDDVTALAHRAPRQAQQALAALKIALRDAAKRGQRFDPNLLSISAPRYKEREPRFLTWPEVEKLSSFMAEGSRRIVLVAALTGLRQGELLSLRESDLSLPAARLRVRNSKTEAGRRSVELPPLAVELLREQLLARPHTETLVFPAPAGGRWNRNNFMARVFRPAMVRAGIGRYEEERYEGPDFHALRHTYVSLMGAAEVDVAVIAAQLGHADGGALLMRRYRHLFPEETRGGALKLEAHIRPGDVEEVESA